MDMGFEQAGFKTVWSNEFDKSFAELHAAGITSWRKSLGNNAKAEIFNTSSIAEVSSCDIIREAFPDGLPTHFGMIGGPPCQDFTINGKMKGFNGDRGKLTIIYLEKVMELKPSFFVMENVTGLIKNEESRVFLQKLLKKVGRKYLIDYQMLNALDFGVPQSRERVFFIGVRKDRLEKKLVKRNLRRKWFPFPVNRAYLGAECLYTWPITSELGTRPEAPADIPLELCVQSCLVEEELISTLSNSNEFFNMRVDVEKLRAIKEGETTRPSFKRLHRYRYSPTACYGNNEVHLHPFLHRRISVREALRIQGVPDAYILPTGTSLSKKFKMIGNGVPVPLAKAVAESIRDFLNDNLKLDINHCEN